MKEIIPIQNLIYEIRGHKIMLDSDIASLYGVLTKNLNKAVKRNIDKFPVEFMFQLTKEEWENLRFQFGTLKKDIRKYLPYVFTEHGVLMTANILNSEKANIISVEIIKVFVRLRQFSLEHKDLSEQIHELRTYFVQYAKGNDEEINKINEAINLLMDKTKPSQIGFKTKEN